MEYAIALTLIPTARRAPYIYLDLTCTPDHANASAIDRSHTIDCDHALAHARDRDNTLAISHDRILARLYEENPLTCCGYDPRLFCMYILWKRELSWSIYFWTGVISLASN